MRKVSFENIAEAVSDAVIDAAVVLPEDVLGALRNAQQREKSQSARDILGKLIENAAVARERTLPLCQDTGLAVLFVRMGSGVKISGGEIADALNEGVRRGYKRGHLRQSVLGNPLTRINTGDNTPAIIHFEPVHGDELTIHFMAKGGGCENMSRAGVLAPAEGPDGVVRFVTETVRKADANPCPPVIVGVGIGGTIEKAALLSKHALLRSLDEHHPDTELAALEAEMLKAINELGIGPQGLGGDTTALGVHLEVFPCHIASLPVAVTIECHSHRTRRIDL